MRNLHVGFSKGQLKIQQMAFVLVAFIILLGLVAVFFISVKTSSLRKDASSIKHEQAQELVRKLAGTPEFAWTSEDCASCVDLDKIMALKNRTSYRNLWGESITLLQIRRVYPSPGEEIECTNGNYPACTKITLLDKRENYTSEDAFVALCHIEPQAYAKCDLGKIVMGVSSP